MIKKLCLLLVIISMVSLPQAVNATSDSYYTETEISNFDDLKGLYSSLGVVEANCEAATRLTKEELIKYAVAYFSGSNQDNYMDIAEIKGYTSAMKADELSAWATGEDLAGVMVKGLGYGAVIEKAGASGGGYFATAMQLGITKGIKITADSHITHFVLLNAFDNAVEIAMMEPKLGSNAGDYELSESKTVLSEVLKIAKYKGVVTGIPGSTLVSDKEIINGFVMINDTIYKTDIDASDMLGCTVNYYVRTIDNETLVYFGGANKYTTKTTYYRDSIKNYADRKYYIYKDEAREKIKEVDLASDAYIIYNGRPSTSLKASGMKPDIGTVELIDNDKDELIDVVIIWSFDVSEVTFVRAQDKKLYLKNEAFEEEQFDSFAIFRSGTNKQIKLEEISKGDVVLIAKSDDGRAVRMEKVSDVVTGTIEGMVDDKIVVGGKEYAISKKCMMDKTVGIGDSARFYTDGAETIIAVTEISTEELYGYFITCAYRDAFGAELEAKIFDQKGFMQILKVAKKIEINGFGGNHADFIEAVKAGADTVQPQVIRFSLSANGEITSVDTAYNFSAKENYKNIQPTGNDNEESFRLVYSKTDPPHVFYPTLGGFGGKFGVYQSFVFMVPSDVTKGKDTEYSVMPGSGMADGLTSTIFDAYVSGSREFVPDVFVLYDFPSGMASKNEFACLVSDMEAAWDEEDGVTTYKLTISPPNGVVGGEVYNYDDAIDVNAVPGLNNETSKCKLDKGDVIYAIWQGDKLLSAKMVYDRETDSFFGRGGFGSDHSLQFGAVYDNVDGVIQLAPLAQLKTIKNYQAQIDASEDENEINTLKKRIKNIEAGFLVYSATGMNKKANVKTADSGKVQIVSDQAINAYISYKDSPEEYSKVLIYTKNSSPWMIIEYVN